MTYSHSSWSSAFTKICCVSPARAKQSTTIRTIASWFSGLRWLLKFGTQTREYKARAIASAAGSKMRNSPPPHTMWPSRRSTISLSWRYLSRATVSGCEIAWHKRRTRSAILPIRVSKTPDPRSDTSARKYGTASSAMLCDRARSSRSALSRRAAEPKSAASSSFSASARSRTFDDTSDSDC
ncbi:uncharacterized protein OGAPODRAFT_16564 [Ogataea polymorpha]|nr:uncharacterized protein OGAPODRAFT_16564 [Ogataea polymorpha]OBA15775.1 hypothetical protein OGAPODRAFT_16564 [Ogataea polymorpha]